MRVIERFDLYMAARKLNDNKVTVQLGLGNGTIGKSRKEGYDLSEKMIRRIVENYPDLNEEWLRSGRGEMILQEPRKTVVQTSAQPSPGIYVPAELAQMFCDLAATVRCQQETISRLTGGASVGEKAG